jgi:hypothetical protein
MKTILLLTAGCVFLITGFSLGQENNQTGNRTVSPGGIAASVSIPATEFNNPPVEAAVPVAVVTRTKRASRKGIRLPSDNETVADDMARLEMKQPGNETDHTKLIREHQDEE